MLPEPLESLALCEGGGGSDSKESACDGGELSSISGLGRCPSEGNSCSRILAWRFPWTEEPGKLQSMGSQRVRHD